MKSFLVVLLLAVLFAYTQAKCARARTRCSKTRCCLYLGSKKTKCWRKRRNGGATGRRCNKRSCCWYFRGRRVRCWRKRGGKTGRKCTKSRCCYYVRGRRVKCWRKGKRSGRFCGRSRCCLYARGVKVRCWRKGQRKLCYSAKYLRTRALRRCRHSSRFVYYSCVFDASRGLYKNKREYNAVAAFLKKKTVKTCFSTGDPHLKSFMGFRWNQYPKQNKRLLFKSGNVKVTTDICYTRWGRRGANCRVRVWKGKSYFTAGISGKVYKRGNAFHVERRGRSYTLHCGSAIVKVNLQFKHINVYVTTTKMNGCKGDCCRRGNARNFNRSPHPHHVKFHRLCLWPWQKQPHRIRYVCRSAASKRWEALRRCRHKNKWVFYSCMVDSSRGLKGVRKVYDLDAKFLKRAHGKVCTAWGDPHMISFHNAKWNQYPQGARLLLKSGNVKCTTVNKWSRWGRRAIVSQVTISVGVNRVTLTRYGHVFRAGRMNVRRVGRWTYVYTKQANFRVYRGPGYLNVYVHAKKLKECKGDCCRRTSRGPGNPYAVRFRRTCRWK